MKISVWSKIKSGKEIDHKNPLEKGTSMGWGWANLMLGAVLKRSTAH